MEWLEPTTQTNFDLTRITNWYIWDEDQPDEFDWTTFDAALKEAQALAGNGNPRRVAELLGVMAKEMRKLAEWNRAEAARLRTKGERD